jgi:hypothetical protein
VGPRLKDMGQVKGNKRKKLPKKKKLMGRKGNYASLLFMVKSIITQLVIISFLRVGREILSCKAHPKYITNLSIHEIADNLHI